MAGWSVETFYAVGRRICMCKFCRVVGGKKHAIFVVCIEIQLLMKHACLMGVPIYVRSTLRIVHVRMAWESIRMADGEARSFLLSCFTSISGLFSALCPFYTPKGPLPLHHLPPCPWPRRITLRLCPPHAYLPGIHLQIALMNSYS